MDIYLGVHLPLKKLQFMVIDEADKMMDMGFMPAINRILEVVPRKRQNLLFSATFPPKVESLSGDFLKFPVKIEVAPQATPAPEVRQCLYHVPNSITTLDKIGRASCREGGCKYVEISVCAESYKKKKK